MVERGGVPGVANWRDAAAYEYALVLPRVAWAWEFARRDPDYRPASGSIVPMVRRDGVTILSLDTAGEPAHSGPWLFRRRAA
ncbi:MAG: hypothetical protein KGJ66_10560 [Alphaproteobacteria bacterium]|nr:hypothetical protein [Alphaproteobacteria bacterium]